MVARGNFDYGNQKVPMEMGWVLANTKMEDLGLDIIGILSDNFATLQTMLLDNKTMLRVWYYYVHEHTNDDWETALETLDNTQGGLENFKEEFFRLVVSFTGSGARKLLVEAWEQAKKEMRDSRRIKSMISSSNSSDEQESIQEDTLSENS